MAESEAPTHHRLTILQLVPESLPSFRADVTALFGKYLPRNGVLCDIVGKPGKGDAAAGGFASVRRPPAAGGRWRREWAFLALCLRSLLAADKRRCDVIQVRDMVLVSLFGLLIARAKGIPFVYWMSFMMCEGRIDRAEAEIAGGGGLYYRVVLLRGKLERALLNRLILPAADHVFVQSDAMLAYMVRAGLRADKMTAVPMGVDTEVVAPVVAPRRPEGWEAVPLMAYLGTLDRMRRLDVMVDTLAQVRASHPGACLLLIGDSSTPGDIVKLRAHIAGLGLTDAVRITGWLPTAEAQRLLAAADAAVSYLPRGPLLDTNSPTKLLEYLALGLPSVGNDNPDQVHVLAGADVGWLADSNAAALAAAVCAILAAPEQARARAARGPAHIDAIRSYRALAQQVAGQYRRIVTAAARAASGAGSP